MKPGNVQASPHGGGPKIRPNIHCTYFGKDGHSIEKCYQLHSYPEHINNVSSQTPRSQPHNFLGSSEQPPTSSCKIEKPTTASSVAITQEKYDQILAKLQRGRNDPLTNFAGIALSSSLNDTWIIDSEATNHMCSSSQLLQSLSPNTFLLSVQMADGSTA